MSNIKKKNLKHQTDDYSTPKDDQSEQYLFRPIICDDRKNSDTIFRPNYTGHILLSQRIAKDAIEPNVEMACKYSRSVDEKIDAKQASFKGLTQSCLDSVTCKVVSSRRNKNQVLRMSQNIRYNHRVSYRTEITEEVRGEHAQRSKQNERPRVPVSYNSETDEDMYNLQGIKDDGCYKDIVILNSENDTEAANNFRQQLLHLDMPDVTVDIFEDISPGTSEMTSLSMLHEQYRTVLLFITSSFAKDNFRRHQAEVLLRKSLETEVLGRWVVPVWIHRDAQKSVSEWAPIKGINYYLLQKCEEKLLKQLTDLVISARTRGN